MLIFAKLPLSFWAEAVGTACFVQNRSILNKPLGMTPYEALNKRKPNVKFFHIFGCRCFVLNKADHLGKFDPKADEAIFVGYAFNSRAYRVLNRRTRVIQESFDVSFDENYIPKRRVCDTVPYIMETDRPSSLSPCPSIPFDTIFPNLFDDEVTATESDRANVHMAPCSQVQSPASTNVITNSSSVPIESQVEGESSNPLSPFVATFEGERNIPPGLGITYEDESEEEIIEEIIMEENPAAVHAPEAFSNYHRQTFFPLAPLSLFPLFCRCFSHMSQAISSGFAPFPSSLIV